MCVLIQKVNWILKANSLFSLQTANLPDGGLDTQLMPLVEVILAKDLQDLVPYALQITGRYCSIKNKHLYY